MPCRRSWRSTNRLRNQSGWWGTPSMTSDATKWLRLNKTGCGFLCKISSRWMVTRSCKVCRMLAKCTEKMRKSSMGGIATSPSSQSSKPKLYFWMNKEGWCRQKMCAACAKSLLVWSRRWHCFTQPWTSRRRTIWTRLTHIAKSRCLTLTRRKQWSSGVNKAISR